jgi:hypothetical protein
MHEVNSNMRRVRLSPDTNSVCTWSTTSALSLVAVTITEMGPRVLPRGLNPSVQAKGGVAGLAKL